MTSRLYFSSILTIFLFLLFSSCGSGEKKDAPPQRGGPGGPGGGGPGGAGGRPPVRSDAFVVKTQMLLDNIEIPGTLVANEETEIHPEVAGRITGIYFREGAFVNRGALLVKLNDADLQAQKRKLMVQLQVAK